MPMTTLTMAVTSDATQDRDRKSLANQLRNHTEVSSVSYKLDSVKDDELFFYVTNPDSNLVLYGFTMDVVREHGYEIRFVSAVEDSDVPKDADYMIKLREQ